MPAATRAPKTTMRMMRVTGMESSPAFFRSSMKAAVDLLRRADAERADEHVWIGLLRLVDCGDDGVDLLDGVVGIAADLEVDERCMPGLADLAGVLGIERRLDVHDHVQGGDSGDHVLDCGREGRILDGQRLALDEHALSGRLHEFLVEELVDAARFAHAGRGRLDLGRAADDAEREGDDDEGKPAEDGGLAVLGAPSAHTPGEVGGFTWSIGRRDAAFLGCLLVRLVLDDSRLHRCSSRRWKPAPRSHASRQPNRRETSRSGAGFLVCCPAPGLRSADRGARRARGANRFRWRASRACRRCSIRTSPLREARSRACRRCPGSSGPRP